MLKRHAAKKLRELASQFKAVALVGPRQSGKTTLVKKIFSKKPYVSLENLDERSLALNDPRQFLSRFPDGAILDEVQRAPELFSYLQQILDESDRKGLFILSGSNNFLLLESITQSLAGRIGYIDLLPLSWQELKKYYGDKPDLDKVLFNGGYPPVAYENVNASTWFSSYIRTYVERDVRQIKNISSLELFQKLLYLCVGRVGQQLNLTNLANEVGTDHKTIQSWLGIMQASYIIFLLQPFYKNFNKRIVKAPKLYFYDTGLACFLLGIRTPQQLVNHMSRGFLFENFIVIELLKNRYNNAQQNNLFYFRDSTGNELDIILDKGIYQMPIEIKSGETLNESFFKNLVYWKNLTNYQDGRLIYAGERYGFKQQGFMINSWMEIDKL